MTSTITTTTDTLPIIIGITAYGRDEQRRFFLPGAYIDAVRAAGGIPVMLPPGETHIERLLQICDGIIFAGGGDIDPAHYGEQLHPTNYDIDPERDTFELELARRVVTHTAPVLGICRGAQLLAVAGGSKLVPHVPEVFGTTIAHRSEQQKAIPHHITLDEQSRLAHMLDTTSTMIQSWHHQAVQAVPPGWRAVAHAADGVIEAMEHRDHPWLIAVQWHPELSPENPPDQRLFRSFVAAARHTRAARNNAAPFAT